MQPLERFPATADVAPMLAALERDGGVIVERMFDRATIDAIRTAADERAAAVDPGSATQGLGEDGAAFVGGAEGSEGEADDEKGRAGEEGDGTQAQRGAKTRHGPTLAGSARDSAVVAGAVIASPAWRP